MEFVSFVREAVKQMNEEEGDDSIKVRSYSGRGMYGATCLGITTDRYTNPHDVIMKIVVQFVEENHEDKNFLFKFRELTDCLQNPKQDSMGLGIVTYFPDIDWEEDDEDEDPEEDDEE